MSDGFVGEIRMVGFNFAPQNWALCNGQVLSTTQNSSLFAIVGTIYGGNGNTTFALPDLRGRLPVHTGQGPGLSAYALGQSAGTESVTLLPSELPAHNHGGAPLARSTVGTSNAIAGNIPAKPSGNARFVNVYSNAASDTALPNAITPAGNNGAHENRMPYQCVTFIICLLGIFPSRS